MTARFRVALTFDAEHPDRPSAASVEPRLLDLLRDEDLRATFFVQGRWAEAFPELARRIPAEGHLVGSHSHYHARVPLFSARGLATDVATAEQVIRDILGVDPKPWFRCPFGAGMDDARVTSRLQAAGYRHVGWDVVGEDWDPARTGRQVEDAVVTGAIAHGDDAVVLLHTWPDRMLAAMPGIVRRLRDAGATFARIDELDRVNASGPSVDELAGSA